MPLIWDDEVMRVDLASGDWVDLKPPSAGDRAYAMRQATHIAGRPFRGLGEDNRGMAAMEDVEMTMDISAFNFALAERCIKAWSFKMPDGSPAPITRDNIERLDDDSWTIITQRLNELSGGRTEAEKKGSRRSS